jgi:hypothetical protein
MKRTIREAKNSTVVSGVEVVKVGNVGNSVGTTAFTACADQLNSS